MALPGTSEKLGLGLNSVEARNMKVDPEKSMMLHGFATANTHMTRVHPLEGLEQNYRQRQDAMNFALLKKTQGLHAPLKLMMERNAASKVGRLPFLHSSNVMLEVLEGRDDEIGPEDVLNDPTQPELMGAPQLVCERQLGIL